MSRALPLPPRPGDSVVRPTRRLRSVVAVAAAVAAVVAPVLLLPTPLVAQPDRPAIAAWNTEQGLPANNVLGIAQTRDGYLWLASYQGLVRFDGVTFRTFTESDIPGLDRASFWAVAADPAGTLWAASESGGMVSFDGRRWRVHTTRDGLKSDRITALMLDHDGVLWVGSRTGVSRIVGGRIEPLPPPVGMDEPSVTALARDRDGTLWIGTVASGLLRYRDGRYTRLTTRDGLADDRISSLHADSAGALWVGAYGAGLTRLQDGVATRVAADGAAAPQRVNDMLRGRDGTLWLAADNGLFRLAGASAVPVRQRDGRGIPQAEALHVDAEGNLWIGARQGGLFRLRPASVRTLGVADGLPHELVSAVDGDGAGGVWIATLGGVVHRTPGGTTTYTRASGALPDDIARDILRDRTGAVWVATNGGLTRLRDGRATTFTARDGLSDDRARALFEDHTGALWIGTFNGLTELRDGHFRRYGRPEGLPDPYILSVFEDRAGTLWVGTQSAGLFRRTANGFAPGPHELARQPVFRMSESADGTLWVGSARGLARLRDGRVRLFTTRDGLPGNAIFQAIDDGAGALWLTGPWGIGRVWLTELDEVAAGVRRTVTVKEFGSDDGLAAREASSIARAWHGPDGVLRFPTPQGLALIDPRRVRPNTLPPPTHVERVVVDGVPVEGSEALDLPPGTRKLEFQFTAPSFVAPTQLRFRYRLDGFDQDWVDGGTQRHAVYTHLSPGRYHFRVQARNEDGVWSDAAATVPVRLRPHVWQTWWFVVLVLAALGALALAAHRLRVRAVSRAVREETLRAMSLRDELTGLYNRRGLFALAEQEMRTAERQRRGFTLVFADMDGMKAINDAFGHQQGDRALMDAAELLRATFRGSDVLARLGGDEFALLVPDGDGAESTAGTESAEGAAEVGVALARLQQAIELHNATAGRRYQLALSVGYSRFDPERPQGIEALLDAADRQMYAQKRVKAAVRA
ncbi:MAG TPA: two-component regulator propeller domain-containing protein [Gemmatimonadaceae bacterium]|nr:two-component regulator propeller domain-containing protein [Gemmatimonadaceae bacterium]